MGRWTKRDTNAKGESHGPGCGEVMVGEVTGVKSNVVESINQTVGCARQCYYSAVCSDQIGLVCLQKSLCCVGECVLVAVVNVYM